MPSRLSRFIGEYVKEIPSKDIGLFSPVDLYGALLCHWRFAADRQAGQAKVRAYNPIFDEDGWQSSHTIIEIINDDMPFLVDSICLALNRLGLTYIWFCIRFLTFNVMPMAISLHWKRPKRPTRGRNHLSISRLIGKRATKHCAPWSLTCKQYLKTCVLPLKTGTQPAASWGIWLIS